VDVQIWSLVGIAAYVFGVAYLSRYIAMDMDSRGKPGWLFGMLTFLMLPLGLALWLMERNRSVERHEP
jgi:hypothetical protein